MLVCEAVSGGNRRCLSCGARIPLGGKGRPRIRCVGCVPPSGVNKYVKRGYRPRTYYDRRCVVCAVPFRTENRTTVTCGVRCGNRRAQASRAARVSLEKARVCLQCGVSFREGVRSKKQRDANAKQKFCGRPCSSQWRRQETQRRQSVQKDSDPKKTKTAVVRCTECGSDFRTTTGHTKCAICRYRVPKVTHPCLDCGASVTGTAARKRCQPCGRRRCKAISKSNPERVKKHRERARKFGVVYEPINPIAIFDRDGWRCHICGKRTPKAKRGTYAKNAPELDHIVAMALGGGHTKENVACACRACNGAKGARVLGQPSLLARL